jgi:glycosyltransferase involved in cell wall biosynthesis
MSAPTVAVITRTKNRPGLLSRAIKSVLEQTFEDFLMVIVNDGGDKKSVMELVNKNKKTFAGRIQVINNEKSLGMEAASNAGIKQSESKYITLLDDDDTWHPDFLKETVSFLEDNPEYKGAITVSELIREKIENGKPHFLSRERFSPFTEVLTLFSIAGDNQFTNNSFIYSRDAIKKVGYYDESLPVLGDWGFNIRFMKLYDIAFINKPLSYYHQRPEEIGTMGNTGYETHRNFNAQLLNKSLRKDIEDGNVGKGLIGNLANYNYRLLATVRSQQLALDDINTRSSEAKTAAEAAREKIENLQNEVAVLNRKIDNSLERLAIRLIRRLTRRNK